MREERCAGDYCVPGDYDKMQLPLVSYENNNFDNYLNYNDHCNVVDTVTTKAGHNPQ